MELTEDHMGVPLKDMLRRLPEDRQRQVAARTQELVAQEMSLRDLRKAAGKTQVALGKKLKLGQANVARVEQRTDMLLSTLDGYLRGLGGRLRLVVEFEGRAPVTLSGLAGLSGKSTKAPRGRAASAASPRRRPVT
jgi:hypothetical protein